MDYFSAKTILNSYKRLDNGEAETFLSSKANCIC